MLIKFANYGQERETNATETELEIFEIVKALSGREDVVLTRKSDNYVTAAYKGWDLARFKYTKRAKWISFPIVEVGNSKNYIEGPEEVEMYSDAIARSVEHIEKYI